MKIICPLCDATVAIGRFVASSDGIEVHCTACGDDFSVSTGGEVLEAAPPVELGPEELRCPKCLVVQPRAASCRQCGLRAERMDDFAAAQDDEAPPELVRLWRQLEASWHDDAAHDRFVEAASARGAFAYAARRYRSVAAERPTDRRGPARLARLSRMAEAALLAAAAGRSIKAEPGSEPYKGVVLMLVGLLFLAGLGGAYLLLAGGKGDGERVAPPPLPADGPRLRAPGPAPTRGTLNPPRREDTIRKP